MADALRYGIAVKRTTLEHSQDQHREGALRHRNNRHSNSIYIIWELRCQRKVDSPKVISGAQQSSASFQNQTLWLKDHLLLRGCSSTVLLSFEGVGSVSGVTNDTPG